MTVEIVDTTEALYNVPVDDADEMEDLRSFVALVALKQGPTTSQWIDDVRSTANSLWVFYGRRAKARLANLPDPEKPEIDMSGLAVQILFP
jgi:hypothetical protein